MFSNLNLVLPFYYLQPTIKLRTTTYLVQIHWKRLPKLDVESCFICFSLSHFICDFMSCKISIIEKKMESEPGKLPVSCNFSTHRPTLSIYNVFPLYVLPNLVTSFSCFKLFLWTLKLFRYSLFHFFCSSHYNFCKSSDLRIFSHKAILFWGFWFLVSLSYFFNFFCPWIRVNLKPTCRLLHRALFGYFIIKKTPHLNKIILKIFTRNSYFLQFNCFFQ